MNEEIITQIPQMQLEELWNLFDMLERTNAIDSKEYEKVKYGYDIYLDIRRYIRFLNDIPTGIKKNYKAEKVIVGRKVFTSSEFDDEIDYRMAVMRNALFEYYDTNDSTVEARVQT